MNRTPKILKGNLQIGSAVTSKSWNAIFSGITAQQHPNYVDPNTSRSFYDGRDINVNDYVVTDSLGKCLKITSITSQNDVSISCVLEDVDEVNKSINYETPDGKILNGQGYIFEVNNGVPLLFPLPSALASGFTFTFAAQLLARFLSVSGIGQVPEDVLTASLLNVANGIPTLDSNLKLNIDRLPTLTKSLVGLSNVDNTSDLNKPISSAVQTALNSKMDLSSRGVPNGVAALDADGLISASNIPGGTPIISVTNYVDLPAVGDSTKVYVVTSQDAIYVWSGTQYIDITQLTGGGGSNTDDYEYIAITTDTLLESKQVVALLNDDLTLTLPSEPANGAEIIILNTSGFAFTLTNGAGSETINGSINDYYASEGKHKNLYLVYINDWKLTDSNTAINVNTATEAKASDEYWTANIVHSVTEESVFGGKVAFIEAWKNTISNTVIAQQITIFEDYNNSDNYRQVWFPNEGIALEKRVVFTTLSALDIPAVSYYNNLAFTLSKAMNLNWRNYEYFEVLISSPLNFHTIIGSQELIDIISSNTDFLFEFTESIQHFRLELPVSGYPMTSNTYNYGSILTGNYFEDGVQVLGTTQPINAWKLFDNNPDTYWESLLNDVTNEAVAFELSSFGGQKSLFPHTIQITTSDADKCPKHVKVQRLSSATWITVAEFILDNSKTFHEFKITTASIADESWRFVFVDNWGGDTIKVNGIKMIGWNTNLLVIS